MFRRNTLRGLFLPTLSGLGDTRTNLLALNKWFVRLRWMAGISYGLLVVLLWLMLGARIAGPQLLLVAGAILLYNSVFAVVLAAMSKKGSLPPRHLFLLGRVQVIADLISLTLLIHFTGGFESPLALFYLFHIVIASIILSRSSGYVYATLAVALYVLLITVNLASPESQFHIEGFFPAGAYGRMPFAIGTAVTLALTGYLCAYLATTIVERMRQREMELAKAYTELARTEEKKSRFMRSAAHHLRSPLSSIYMCLRTVEGNYASSDRQKEVELLERARTRSKDMLNLISDLITLSRLKDVDLSRVEEGAVEFDPALREVVDSHKEIAEGRRIDMTVDYGADGSKVWANRDQLCEIMANLVSNAIKYTPEEGRIQIASRRGNGTIELQVTDNGIGIPPEERKHLFEEFFRATNAKKMSSHGTGLGLCISRELLKKTGGEIRVESQVDKGSTFTVTIPEWKG